MLKKTGTSLPFLFVAILFQRSTDSLMLNPEREEKVVEEEQKSLEERVRVLKNAKCKNICKYLFCLSE